MKRILLFTLALLMILPLFAACNEAEPPANESNSITPVAALDLTAEWNKYFTPDSLVQGCVVVRKAFAEEHPAVVAKFLEEYGAALNFTISNPADASVMIADAGIFAQAAVAQKAIPKCNLCFITGAQMKTSLSAFLSAMPIASIGGKLPSDDFYYQAPAGAADVSADSTLSVRVWTLNGTTGFGMAPLIESKKSGDTALNYTFTVETNAANVQSALINGTADIAALPTNAASALYNKTNGEILVLALNTRGVLYLVANTAKVSAPTSLADLAGKKVYCPAQNPSFIAKTLFEKAGVAVELDSATYAAPADLQAAVAQGLVDYAVLPEPMVTIAQASAASNTAK